MRLASAFLLLTGLITFSQTATAPAARTWENLNAVLWMQTSAEYRATVLQTYRAAEASLMRALVDRTWTAALEQTNAFAELPPAVILDLDETVLDNTAFQAQLTAEHGSYTEPAWSGWMAKARSGLLPGAADFLAIADGHGIAVFYITNRLCDPARPDDPTVVLLRTLHLPLRAERLLCKTEGTDKSQRRARVACRYRVLLLIGDDLNDFVTLGRTQASVEARRKLASVYERYWGDRWFLIPNPAYGSWERAVGSRVEEKLRALRR